MVYRAEGDEMTGRTWVVVADSSHASIYLREQRYSPLKTVATFEDTNARTSEQAQQRIPPENGHDGRQQLDPDHDPKAHSRQVFARQVCGSVEHARCRGEFRELILIAPPRLLGMMRDALTKPTLDCVRREIPKNLVNAQPERIMAYLAN